MPPTYVIASRASSDWRKLSATNQNQFTLARKQLVEDLAKGNSPRPGLRVKGVQGHPGVFEMTWAPDGRATFEFGKELRPGHRHVIWRRIGDHSIFTNP